jgi:undecaprenyl-diphosphatase
MCFSKEIRYYLICLAAILPVLFNDRDVIVWIREFRNANPDISLLLLNCDKSAYYAAHGTPLIGGALLLYLFGRYFDKQLVRELGKRLFVGFVCSGIAVQAIKHLIGRARPRITDELLFIGPTIKGSYDSFPSGHAAMSFCLAYICSRFFPGYSLLFYLYAALVCLGRVGSASHFPADVLSGALLGIIIARLVEKKFGKPGESNADSLLK